MALKSKLIPVEAIEPTSAAIRERLAELKATRATAAADVETLKGQRSAVLLTGDDTAAEAHDATIARLRRTIERSDLQIAEAARALTEAEEREEVARTAEKQAEAEVVVRALIERVEADYEAPARRIAAFLADWNEVERVALAAGIPTLQDRLRHAWEPAVVLREEQIEQFQGYIDEDGRPTSNPHPYKPDGMIDYTTTRRTEIRTRVASPRQVRPGFDASLPPLPGSVNLPAASFDSAHGDHWSGDRVKIAI